MIMVYSTYIRFHTMLNFHFQNLEDLYKNVIEQSCPIEINVVFSTDLIMCYIVLHEIVINAISNELMIQSLD